MRLLIILYSLIFSSLAIPFFLNNISELATEFQLQLHNSVNASVNPCKYFYEFSCDKWINDTEKPKFELFWNHHLSVHYKIINRLKSILEDENLSPKFGTSFSKAQIFYKTCMESNETVSNQYLHNLRIVVNFFKGWPLTSAWKHDRSYLWLIELMQITKILKVQPLLKFSINLDYKNTSTYAIYIEPGNLIYPQFILTNPDLFKDELKAYEKWIFHAARTLFPRCENKHFKSDLMKIIEFEMALAKIMNEPKFVRLTLEKLSKKIPIGYWPKIFNHFVGEFNKKVRNDSIIIIRDYEYLKRLFLLLKRTDKRIIANYMIWHVIKDLSRDTTNYMRHLSFMVDKSVFGVEEDLPREIECINQVAEHFSYAVLAPYNSKYSKNSTLKEVAVMSDNIKKEFLNILRNNTWMLEETKKLAIEKVEYLKILIGYPKWIKDVSLVDKYYENLLITDNHFLNILKIKSFEFRKEFFNFEEQVNETVWPSNIFETNAYYSVLQNAIFIPISILEPPFFDIAQPRILNYGALGSIIGHEISHSLDTTGRQANKNGIISKWWPVQDVKTYKEMAYCYINNSNDDKLISIGENMADSIGFDISLKAFEKLVSMDEKIAISNKKYFFIAFAQMWCEKYDLQDLFNDEHATSKKRVENVMKNNKKFAEVFHCVSQLDNQRCRIW